MLSTSIIMQFKRPSLINIFAGSTVISIGSSGSYLYIIFLIYLVPTVFNRSAVIPSHLSLYEYTSHLIVRKHSQHTNTQLKISPAFIPLYTKFAIDEQFTFLAFVLFQPASHHLLQSQNELADSERKSERITVDR